MTTANQISGVDRNITRVIDTLRANRGLSTAEVIERSGITESTYHRHRKQGGWTAREIASLAQALDADEGRFYRDADDVIPRRTSSASGMAGVTEEYDGGNDDVMTVAA